MNLVECFRFLEKNSYQEFYKVESEFYLLLSKAADNDILPCIITFLTVSSWFGTSQRGGVWSFYEVANPEDIKITVEYLKQTKEYQIAQMLQMGVHDYQNPIYQDNFDYPSQWIKESEEIDNWIAQHEELLWKWEYKLLLDNRDSIVSFLG